MCNKNGKRVSKIVNRPHRIADPLAIRPFIADNNNEI